MAYVPIFSSILRSSILLEDVSTRWLWTVILILADETREAQGILDCPVERLAQIANLSVEETRAAIEKLCSPDANSHGKDEDGRRLVALESAEGFADRKWRVVNWQRYKDEVRKLQVAAAVKRHRMKSTVIRRNRKQSNRNPPAPAPTPAPSPDKKDTVTVSRRRPADADEVRAFVQAEGLDRVDPDEWFGYWEDEGWKKKTGPVKDWRRMCRNWNAILLERGRPPVRAKTTKRAGTKSPDGVDHSKDAPKPTAWLD